MVRAIRIAVAVVIGSGMLCLAGDPPTPAPPAKPAATPPAPGTRADADQPAEVLEAQLDVKKAHVRAAEVGLRGATEKLDRVMHLRTEGSVTEDAVAQARLEVETAAALLDVRKAEVREAEARLKHARKEPAGAKPAGTKIAVFNMAAVMRDFGKAKYQVYLLNKKRIEMSGDLPKWRTEYIETQKQIQDTKDEKLKKELGEKLITLARKIEDEDRKINATLNDDASVIISNLYDEITTVVDKVAEANGCRVVFAYPDVTTDEERKNPYMRELKLKPPAAQPFYVAKDADITGEVLRKLNELYPAIDEDGKKVDVNNLPFLNLPANPFPPKRD